MNAAAPRNMPNMGAVTCDVSHEPMAWLNAAAASNIIAMSVTCEVSHEPISWLNAAALLNMLYMAVTWEVSQVPMSSLNELESKTTPPHPE